MKTETMKYRVLCHILVFLLCVGGLLAQTVVRDSAQMVQSTQASVQAERTAWNTVHLELLGLGLIYSVSYERHLSKSFALRFGASYAPPPQGLGIIIPNFFEWFFGRWRTSL